MNALETREQYYIDILNPAFNCVKDVTRRFSEKILTGVWFTDGTKDLKFLKDDVIPEGFRRGRAGWSAERKAAWTGPKNPMKGKSGEAHHLFGTKRTDEQGARQSEKMKARYAAGEIAPFNKGTADRRLKACLGCQKEFLTPLRKPDQVWCSRACKDGRGSKLMACIACGTERRVNLSQIKLGNGEFCSQSCRTKHLMTPERSREMLERRWRIAS